MEQFSDNTRFILSCNYSSKIIDPIQSRCAVFRFSPLSDAAVAAQTREIAAAEGIEVTDEGVDALVYAADGRGRRHASRDQLPCRRRRRPARSSTKRRCTRSRRPLARRRSSRW